MALSLQGAYGAYSGKIGNTIGASWKGISYIRIKPAHVANPRTAAQMTQRNKFKLMLNFLRPLKPALKLGFKEFAVRKSAFNCAMSYNLQNAVDTDNLTSVVNYSNVLVSRGSRKGVFNADVSSLEPAKLLFTWDDNSDNVTAHDQAFIVVYNPSENEAIIETSGGKRIDMVQTVTVPAYFSGDVVHTWIAFASPDGRLVSDSRYAGEVNVF